MNKSDIRLNCGEPHNVQLASITGVALAIGNVTGAMVFQGSIITAIGIMMTDWQLNAAALLTVALTFASVGMA